MSKNKTYIAGDMLTKASQLLRAKEKEDIERIGLPFYNPQDNKEINDKANLDNNDGLAEKIVKADTDAIYSSDIIVIEPQPFALGTHVELGQIKGRKDLAKEILELLENEDLSPEETGELLYEKVSKAVNQKIYPHYEDARRFKGAVEAEDRRALGINQYVYGVCLDLTDGKGFYEWDEILDELKEIKNSRN
ncbi:nucleoside 2-deoxyribosyltransferase [Bacillus andreraoultii]|uniref:nucleoside 2-deoxyribosyltransferase n=1 Tax=Bacillus andreraoultii TaxID=1499685 RepID=UPI00053B8544|nr:nucleoside 2-deoxyribosyltransferase [Bacillus andreraoultii]